jgi:hypothetical protein
MDRAYYSQRIGRGPLANPTIEDVAGPDDPQYRTEHLDANGSEDRRCSRAKGRVGVAVVSSSDMPAVGATGSMDIGQVTAARVRAQPAKFEG